MIKIFLERFFSKKVKAMEKKGEVIFQTKSLGTTIQVVDKLEYRELRFGNHVVQSAVSKTTPDFLLLSYTRYMMLGLLLRSPLEDLLHIGLGAGNLPRFLHKHFPHVWQEVLELNPQVVAVARQYFNLPHDRIVVRIGDGLEGMVECEKNYDLIFLDAFEPEGAPAHLLTPPFFQRLHQHLKPGGWVVGNAWTANADLSEQMKTWQEVFEIVWKAPVPAVGNVIFFGGNTPQPFDKKALEQKARNLQEKIPLKFLTFLKSLEPVI